MSETCYACKNDAVCVGRYEGHGPIQFCCDECCGHGNEDGWCVPVEDVGGLVSTVNGIIGEFDEVIGHAKAALTAKKEG